MSAQPIPEEPDPTITFLLGEQPSPEQQITEFRTIRASRAGLGARVSHGPSARTLPAGSSPVAPLTISRLRPRAMTT